MSGVYKILSLADERFGQSKAVSGRFTMLGERTDQQRSGERFLIDTHWPHDGPKSR